MPLAPMAWPPGGDRLGRTTRELEAGSMSVGTWIELEHVAPSPIGLEVVAAATLIRPMAPLEFDVTLSDSEAAVERGRRPELEHAEAYPRVRPLAGGGGASTRWRLRSRT